MKRCAFCTNDQTHIVRTSNGVYRLCASCVPDIVDGNDNVRAVTEITTATR